MREKGHIVHVVGKVLRSLTREENVIVAEAESAKNGAYTSVGSDMVSKDETRSESIRIQIHKDGSIWLMSYVAYGRKDKDLYSSVHLNSKRVGSPRDLAQLIKSLRKTVGFIPGA